MDRRDFLRRSALIPVAGLGGIARAAADPTQRRLLVLVELKGGNDGLNTVVPFADPEYGRLRPRLAIAREQVVQLTERTGLHPALAPLKPAWDAGELAIVQGVGYPDPNLSHFRSIEIWDTASRSDEYLDEGWLARAIERSPCPASYAAEGVVVGAGGMGPLAGRSVRAIALASPEQFVRNAHLAHAERARVHNASLSHILDVENRIAASADRLGGARHFRTGFPAGAFGNAALAAAQLAANPAGVAVVRLSLASFDTHANQQAVHANLLRQLAEGLAALRSALIEADLWKRTVVATYGEFGRRPRENESGGTDHGTSSAHLVLGGAVRGGLHGAEPALRRLDGNGNLAHAVDFRAYYATFLERWWAMDSRAALGGRFAPLDLVRQT
ncbi:MAG TPA: DUF1501 domain-containing protein [Usitatibacter sp.]|nr:DUF1501 domain-containing protein [Usitatibacter sp.]